MQFPVLTRVMAMIFDKLVELRCLDEIESFLVFNEFVKQFSSSLNGRHWLFAESQFLSCEARKILSISESKAKF